MAEPVQIPTFHTGSRPVAALADQGFEPSEAARADITPLQVAMRRRWAILLFAALVTAVIGIAVKQLPPRYTASASVMVDPRQPRLSSGETLLPSQIVDLDLLRTYMEALRSPSLVRDVVRQLGLETVPHYCAAPEDLGAGFRHLIAGPFGRVHDAAARSAPCRASIESVARRLTPSISFSNDGRSYIISISVVAGDPDTAAGIANAYAGAFIARRRQQQVGLTDQADAWLRNHLAHLRADLLAADDAVQRQRQGGQLTSLRGQTLLGQSLTEMNSQLIVASGELAKQQSTLHELESAARAGPGSVGAASAGSGWVDASAPILASPIIQGMIEREGVLAAAQAELSTRLGSANTELVANAAQLARVRQQIRTEVNKAVASVRGEVEALQARCAALRGSVQDLQAQVGEQGIADTRLQDLQRDAASARGRYDEASLRLEQIHVESALQRADVQLVVEASAPDLPSFPRVRMIVTGAFLAMLGVGAGLAYALELLSRVFSTAEQVEGQTGIRVLGLFPKPASTRGSRWGVRRGAMPHEASSREAEALQAVFAGLIGPPRRETTGGRVLLVTSALPGEGKTSFSVALGRAAAARGLSVVVVDCDLRRSSLGSHFPLLEQSDLSRRDAGLEREPEPDFAALSLDRSSGLHVVIAQPRSRNPHAILASASLPRALEQLRANHDVVIIDTPPVLAVPDVLGIAPLADDVVMVVGWRSSRRTAVLAAIKALRRAHIRVSGVVLSKVDLRRFARSNTDSGYYARVYSAYRVLPPA